MSTARRVSGTLWLVVDENVDEIERDRREPESEEERRAMLHKGLFLLGGGLAVFAGCIARIAWDERTPLRLLYFAVIYPIAHGAWLTVRALRPEKAPVVERSTCWECSRAIPQASDGFLCAQCQRPVHHRCRKSHERLAGH